MMSFRFPHSEKKPPDKEGLDGDEDEKIIRRVSSVRKTILYGRSTPFIDLPFRDANCVHDLTVTRPPQSIVTQYRC